MEDRSFVKYNFASPRDNEWGLTVSTVGYEKIAPGDDYPTTAHGKEYIFSTKRGRILDEYQLVYICSGRGMLETSSAGRMNISEGTMFMLFPGEWHTYSPDRSTGWSQYWIGFKGADIDLRMDKGFFSRQNPIFNIGINEQMSRLFLEAVDIAAVEKSHFQQLLSGIAFHIIGLMLNLDANNRIDKIDSTIATKIQTSKEIMLRNIFYDFSLQDLAQEIGMSYSNFRKRFKEYTGFSPAAYMQSLRINKAISLLETSDMSVKEIAYTLKFDSADYFSAQFKKKTGKSPSVYRKFISRCQK